MKISILTLVGILLLSVSSIFAEENKTDINTEKSNITNKSKVIKSSIGIKACPDQPDKKCPKNISLVLKVDNIIPSSVGMRINAK